MQKIRTLFRTEEGVEMRYTHVWLFETCQNVRDLPECSSGVDLISYADDWTIIFTGTSITNIYAIYSTSILLTFSTLHWVQKKSGASNFHLVKSILRTGKTPKIGEMFGPMFTHTGFGAWTKKCQAIANEDPPNGNTYNNFLPMMPHTHMLQGPTYRNCDPDTRIFNCQRTRLDGEISDTCLECGQSPHHSQPNQAMNKTNIEVETYLNLNLDDDY